MAKPRPSDILFWFLAGLTLALLVVFVLVLAGAIPVESSTNDAAPAESTARQPAAIADSPTATPTTTAPASTQSPDTTTQPSPSTPTPDLTSVVITASRGDCWISARLGSETGEVLDERVLTQGQSVRVRGRRVWLSVGASGNVDVTVNGRARQLPAGTIETVLGPTA